MRPGRLWSNHVSGKKRRMHLLVVDDDGRLLDEVASILSRNGHSVDCVDNAVQAQGMVNEGHYDFILVDYRMPEHDGIWFMNRSSCIGLSRKAATL